MKLSTTKISESRQYYHIQPSHSVLVIGEPNNRSFMAFFYGHAKLLGQRRVSFHREAINILKGIVSGKETI